MRIRDIFPLKEQAGDVGVEVEVEGTNLPQLNYGLWRTTNDPSLKGGKEAYEYVMVKPVKITDLRQVLDTFEASFADAKVDNSIYAGIHIHVNVQQLTAKQLMSYLVSFFVLEELLVHWCGNTRKGNHFCLRSSDAEYLIHYIRQMVVEDRLHIHNKDTLRYSAANLESLSKYGSIEFRCLNSTIKADRIYTWCQVLNNMLVQSQTYPSPDAIMTDIAVNGNLAFVTKMLGVNAKYFLTDGWEDAIQDGISRAQDIAFCRKWDTTLNLNIFKKQRGIFNV